MDRARVVFLGEDSFSCVVLAALLQEGHEVCMVVTPYYENNRHLRLENLVRSRGIEYMRVRDVNSPQVVERVGGHKPDILVIAHFEKLIRGEMIRVPRLGAINIHPSLLPLYRGMSPQHWPIIEGRERTGVTVHYVDEGVDTGNIIVQRPIALDDGMYVTDLQNVWLKMYPGIIVEAVERVMAGDKGVEQYTINNMKHAMSNRGGYYGRLLPEHCRIDLEGGVRRAHALVRGVSAPYHGAWLPVEGGMLKIWRAEIAEDAPTGVPGEVLSHGGKLYLVLSDGALLITRHGYEGGSLSDSGRDGGCAGA